MNGREFSTIFLFHPSYSICASFLTSTGINGPIVKNIIIFWNLWLVCDWSWCRQRSFEKARREHDENSELNPLLTKEIASAGFFLAFSYLPREKCLILRESWLNTPHEITSLIRTDQYRTRPLTGITRKLPNAIKTAIKFPFKITKSLSF